VFTKPISIQNLAGKFDEAKIHMKGLQLMVHQRGGIQNVISSLRNVILWSVYTSRPFSFTYICLLTFRADLCYSNIWDCKPSFQIQPLKITGKKAELPDGMKDKLLSPERTFGYGSPLPSIFQSLRRLSAVFCPEYDARLEREEMSDQIYSVEYDLLALQNKNIETLLDSKQYRSSSSVLMNIAAYIYLYLIIRELPVRSKLFCTLSQRLRDSLEMQDGEWWNSTAERQRWLLWIVFMGYGAAQEWNEKWWFVERMEPLGAAMMVWTKDELKSALEDVIWHQLCDDILEKLWKDISRRDRADLDHY
jgi:hypothetical protein